MARSNRRKKQDRAKAEAKRAEQARRHRGIDVPWLRQELAMPSEREHSPLAKR